MFQLAALPNTLAVSMALSFSSKLLELNRIPLARKIMNNIFSFKRKHSVCSRLLSELYLLKGEILGRQSRNKKVIESYLQSVLLDPGNVSAHKAIINYYLALGTATQVRLYLCKYQAAHPDSLLLSALSSLIFGIFESKHVNTEPFE
jgi:hypothetical protein